LKAGVAEFSDCGFGASHDLCLSQQAVKPSRGGCEDWGSGVAGKGFSAAGLLLGGSEAGHEAGENGALHFWRKDDKLDNCGELDKEEEK
jgi:hypothetical protein